MLQNGFSTLEMATTSEMEFSEGTGNNLSGGFSSFFRVQIKWKRNHSAEGRIWRMTKGDEGAGGGDLKKAKGKYCNENCNSWRLALDQHGLYEEANILIELYSQSPNDHIQ